MPDRTPHRRTRRLGPANPPGSTTLMASHYTDFYAEVYRTHWWWRAREENVLRYLAEFRSWPVGQATILDIGCGDGLMWPQLERLGAVEGIEPDAGMIADDSPWRSRIEVADLLQARLRDRRYDLILMLDVLEHIADDDAGLTRAASMLADGGILLLTVPAMPALWSEWDLLSGHHRRYTRHSLAAVVRSAGLRPLELRYFYSWTVLPLLLRRLFFRADQAEHSHFSQPPSEPVNSAALRVSRLDHRLTRRVPVPFGSSLIAVLSAAEDGRRQSRAGRDQARSFCAD